MSLQNDPQRYAVVTRYGASALSLLIRNTPPRPARRRRPSTTSSASEVSPVGSIPIEPIISDVGAYMRCAIYAAARALLGIDFRAFKGGGLTVGSLNRPRRAFVSSCDSSVAHFDLRVFSR